jgi:hypothetical protein
MKSPHVTRTSVFDTDRRQLSALLGVSADGGERLWNDDELGAILRHQFAASIQADLTRLDRKPTGKVHNVAVSPGLPVKSFGDLLSHPNPPIELLKAAKDFAKFCRLSPHGAIPREIAAVLYFASLAAALVRCRCRITSLSDKTSAEGFRWVQTRPWVDAATRALTEEALHLLDAPSEERCDGSQSETLRSEKQ